MTIFRDLHRIADALERLVVLWEKFISHEPAARKVADYTSREPVTFSVFNEEAAWLREQEAQGRKPR